MGTSPQEVAMADVTALQVEVRHLGENVNEMKDQMREHNKHWSELSRELSRIAGALELITQDRLNGKETIDRLHTRVDSCEVRMNTADKINEKHFNEIRLENASKVDETKFDALALQVNTLMHQVSTTSKSHGRLSGNVGDIVKLIIVAVVSAVLSGVVVKYDSSPREVQDGKSVTTSTK